MQRRVPDLAQVSGVETNAAGDLETLLTGIVTTFGGMPREELFILRLLVSSGSWLLRFWYREIGSQTAQPCQGSLSSLVQWPETCAPQSQSSCAFHVHLRNSVELVCLRNGGMVAASIVAFVILRPRYPLMYNFNCERTPDANPQCEGVAFWARSSLYTACVAA